MKHIVSAILAIALLAGVWAVTFGRQQGALVPGNGANLAAPTSVVFGTVDFSSFTEEFRAIGTAKAAQRVAVLADVAGLIEEIHAIGSVDIAEGAPLVTLERNVQRISVQIAESRLQQARDTLERYETLQSGTGASVSRVAVREASTALAIAESELSLAREVYEQRVIRAPIAGRLGLINLERGDRLAPGSPVVTIDNTESMIVEFEMPERAVPLISVGRTVSMDASLFRGRPVQGRIMAFDSRLDPVTRTLTVRAQVDNGDGLLWPGMTLNVVLAQESDPLATVPAMALTWTREGAQVWRVRDGAVQPVPVVVRARIDDTIWVEGDLEKGDEIVVEGVQKLRSGTKVTQPRLATARQEPA